MPKDASITIRIPAAVKVKLEALAGAEHRTLSAFIAIKLAALVTRTSRRQQKS